MANILYPVFALVLLTFLMAFWMAKERFASVRRGEVKFEPGVRPVFRNRAGQVSNAYHNLLEMPIILAWIYVAFRVVQGLVHATYNKIIHRFGAFVASLTVLAIMWVHLFLHVASAAV